MSEAGILDENEVEEEENEENEEMEIVLNKKKKKKQKKKKKNNLNSNTADYRLLSHYSVTNRDGDGRCAIAKEDISQGVCILREQPYQVMSRGKLCLNCGQLCVHNARTAENAEGKSKNQYCSPDCENLFETTRYRLIKDKLSSIHEISLLHDCSEDLLHISLILFFANHFEEIERMNQFLFIEKNNSTLLSTALGCDRQISHLAKQTPQWKTALCGAFESILFETFSSHFERERDSALVNILLEIAAKVNANSYGIFDDFASFSVSENKPLLGFGVFPVAAMTINHSCRPNLVNIFVNGTMEYRAIRPIKKKEELCVSYTNCLEGFHQRRQELLSSRFFCCSCSRCKLHEHALLTMSASSARNLSADVLADLMLDGLHCNSCGSFFTSPLISLLTTISIGSSGVIVLTMSAPRQCYCIQCRREVFLFRSSFLIFIVSKHCRG
jgi:hypothetical protein